MSELTTISPELEKRLQNMESMLKQLLNQSSEWIEIEEAARLSTLTARTLYNYLDKGKLKTVTHQYRGRKLEFNRDEFIEWNKQRVFRVRS